MGTWHTVLPLVSHMPLGSTMRQRIYKMLIVLLQEILRQQQSLYASFFFQVQLYFNVPLTSADGPNSKMLADAEVLSGLSESPYFSQEL